MKRWAVAIGINQYHLLQPLSFAQEDAQAIRDFWVNEAGFPPDQCLLLSDSSPPVWGKPTYPRREVIQGWLDLLCQHYIQPGDSLWVFFSGYGVTLQGRDYLVPVDANPANLQATAIPVEAIFNRLKAVQAESMLVLLDMSRSQGSLSNESVGGQTAELAKYLEIPTILSCLPGQFSHESLTLKQGFFTAALLEGFRTHPFITLAGLEQFLGDRLMELSHHNWRPVQRALLISPTQTLHQVVLPPLGAPTIGWSFTDSPEHSFQSQAPEGTVTTPYPIAQATEEPVVSQPVPETTSESEDGAAEIDIAPGRSRLFWGGVTAASLLLIAGVCSRHWVSMTQGAAQRSSVTIATGSGIPSNGTAATQKDSQQQPAAASLRASTPPPTIVASAPSLTTNAITAPAGGAPTPGTGTSGSAGSGTGTTVQPAGSSRSSLETARARVSKAINSDQASPYWYAIQEARKIGPEDPDYSQAQAAIAEWSQSIFAIANRRAAQRKFEPAIMAATLVPNDQPIFAKAEQAIDRWCLTLVNQPIRNRSLRRQANKICQQL